MANYIYITKLSGEKQRFSLRKLERSLRRAGASKGLARKIADQIAAEVKPGMTTTDIYQQAHYLLRQYEKGVAARYSLKRALLDLGPAGYPFEKLVGLLLREYGYQVKLNQIIQGRCASYEIDVIAQKGEKKFLVECKFHNRAGYKCDMKTALYVWARFLDIKSTTKDNSSALLVTNTKLTTEALHYSQCVGLHVISWDYPFESSLKKLIDDANLHPLTSLLSLNKNQKQRLLQKGVVFCKQLASNPKWFKFLGLSQRQIKNVLSEIEGLVAIER